MPCDGRHWDRGLEVFYPICLVVDKGHLIAVRQLYGQSTRWEENKNIGLRKP